MSSRARGFTLLELLLAVTLAAMLATASIAALNVFVEADRKVVASTEIDVDVTRALQLLRRDVENAVSIEVTAQQWTIRRSEGSFIVWARPAGDTELHRFVGNDLLALLVPVQALLASITTPPVYDSRGRLRDGSYRSTAVVQGDLAFSVARVLAPTDGTPIGLHVEITYPGVDGRAVQTCSACSLVLAEAHCKPGGSAVASSATSSSGGSGTMSSQSGGTGSSQTLRSTSASYTTTSGSSR